MRPFRALSSQSIPKPLPGRTPARLPWCPYSGARCWKRAPGLVRMGSGTWPVPWRTAPFSRSTVRKTISRKGFGRSRPVSIPYLLDARLLAQILLPGLRDYEPATVAGCLGCALPGGQDAACAARASAQVCLELLDILSNLDPDTLSTLARLAEGGGTGLERVFADTGRSGAAMEIGHRDGRNDPRKRPFDPGSHSIGDGSCEPREASEDPDLLDVDELAGLFEGGGLFESRMSGYEQRSQQVSMVRGVAGAFNDGEVLLVEAGTGTGKSLSYLTPALLWAVRNDLRVIVSTNTRNLQEQLFYKDLPFPVGPPGTAVQRHPAQGPVELPVPGPLATGHPAARGPSHPGRTGGRDPRWWCGRGKRIRATLPNTRGSTRERTAGCGRKSTGKGAPVPGARSRRRVSSTGPGRPPYRPMSSSSIMR